MTTLDDLLALLPDNTTGAIDAADLRTIVTALWDEGADLEARVAALEASSAGGGVVSVTGRWQINPQNTPPGGGQVTVDQVPLSATTELRFTKIDQANNDLTNALVTADAIYGQTQMDAANWASYTVTGPAVDNGSWIAVPVVYVDGAGDAAGAAWQPTIFVLSRSLV